MVATVFLFYIYKLTVTLVPALTAANPYILATVFDTILHLKTFSADNPVKL